MKTLCHLFIHCLSVPHRHFYTLLLTTRWASANSTSHTLQQFLVTFCQGGTSKRSEGGRKREASCFFLGHQKQPWHWLAVAIVAVGYSHSWLQPPGRVAAAPPQKFQQHSHELRCWPSSGKLAASWSLGIASLFFCSFTTTYLLCFALSSKNFGTNSLYQISSVWNISSGSCFPGWTLTNVITSPHGSLFCPEAALVHARGGYIYV